jgi:N-acetylmuramic acid 6-phosphate (MurNAc-6-P) etherase
MKLTRPRLRLVAALAIGGGAVLALALPAGAAVSVASQSPPVQVLTLGKTATLDANGAVVFAPVTVACPPDAQAFLSVSVTERVGNSITSGSVGIQATCTGTPQRLTVAVIPTQAPFKKGVAFGSASLDVCDYTCQHVVDQHDIQIVKP